MSVLWLTHLVEKCW